MSSSPSSGDRDESLSTFFGQDVKPNLPSLVTNPTASSAHGVPRSLHALPFHPLSISNPALRPPRPRMRRGKNHVPSKPPNAWILYRSFKSKELEAQRLAAAGRDPSTMSSPERPHQRDVSKQVAVLWHNETPAVRQHFVDLAEKRKEEHARMQAAAAKVAPPLAGTQYRLNAAAGKPRTAIVDRSVPPSRNRSRQGSPSDTFTRVSSFPNSRLAPMNDGLFEERLVFSVAPPPLAPIASAANQAFRPAAWPPGPPHFPPGGGLPSMDSYGSARGPPALSVASPPCPDEEWWNPSARQEDSAARSFGPPPHPSPSYLEYGLVGPTSERDPRTAATPWESNAPTHAHRLSGGTSVFGGNGPHAGLPGRKEVSASATWGRAGEVWGSSPSGNGVDTADRRTETPPGDSRPFYPSAPIAASAIRRSPFLPRPRLQSGVPPRRTPEVAPPSFRPSPDSTQGSNGDMQ